MTDITLVMKKAYQDHIVIPSFNIPHLPMMEPVVRALKEKGTFGLIAVARLEWKKFQSKSLEAVAGEYERCKDTRVTSLHLDHIPVIDEDHLQVDYMDDIARAIAVGYQSVMVDGSRLALEENIRCVREVVDYAHARNIVVEAELGAVIGHEDGPTPDYEQLFASGKGFTDVTEGRLFLNKTQVDWLSVAVGSVHGAISLASRDKRKVTARLHIGRLTELDEALGIPLVLHGGSGISLPYLKQSFAHGIAKLNIGTDIRQAYESGNSEIQKRENVYMRVLQIIDDLEIAGSASQLLGE
ncbi:MAG: class II fructose-bisphosphate aldolase [Sphaerochaetaceae bacterium]